MTDLDALTKVTTILVNLGLAEEKYWHDYREKRDKRIKADKIKKANIKEIDLARYEQFKDHKLQHLAVARKLNQEKNDA